MKAESVRRRLAGGVKLVISNVASADDWLAWPVKRSVTDMRIIIDLLNDNVIHYYLLAWRLVWRNNG